MSINVTIDGLDYDVDVTLLDSPSDIDPETYTALRGLKGDKGDTGASGSDGADGADGVGISSITQNLDGTLTISLDDGTSYDTDPVKGEKGDKGDKGDTGDDGFSPIVEVEEITGGHTVTITDAEGDHSFNVMDGSSGANVQSDWDETDSTSDAYILNKPTIPSKTSDLANDSNFVADASYVHTDNNYTTADKSKLNGIESGAEVNILESVKVNNTALPISNKAVNIDLSDYATKSDISSVYKFKGTVANYSDLPSSGQTAGDVYNITNADATHDISAGDNVAWTGSAWDKLAGDIDLSNYVEKETGKGLSSNDYTTAEKNKLSGIESGAEVNVQADWNQAYSTEDDYIKNKPNINNDVVRSGFKSDSMTVYVRNDIDTKYDLALSSSIPSWAKQSTKPTYTASEVGALPDDTPLFSGDYNDLTNKPAIPIKYAGGALDVTSETVYLRVHDNSQTCNVVAIATDTVSGISGLYFLLNDGTPDGKIIFIPDANGFNTGSQAIIAQIPTNVSDLTNDSGYISSETDPVFSASAAHGISSSDITNWNGKSDFSGSYNDLSNKPTIPVVGHTIPYGTCSTAKGTVAKVATVSGVTELTEGLTIAVKFSAENTSTNPTLNVNELGAKAIKKYGTTAAGTSAAMSWYAGSVCILIYDGTYWQMVNWDNTNTTYTSMTVAEYEAGTGTTARSITPARLKGAIETWADKTEVTQTLTSGTEIGEVNGTKLYAPSGSSGTTDYSDLTNKPSINNVTLSGNKTTSDLGLFSGDYDDLTNKPTIPTVPSNVSAFTNDAGYITGYTETDPTVPSWAKASTKPTYTASEVGALPDTTVLGAASQKGVVTAISSDSADLPTVTAVKDYVADHSGDEHVELTQAQYDALTQAEKENGSIYFVTDGVPEAYGQWKEAGRTTSTSAWVDVPSTAKEVCVMLVHAPACFYSGTRTLAEPFVSTTVWTIGGYSAGGTDYGIGNVNMRNNGYGFQKRNVYYGGTNVTANASLIVYYR